MSCNSSSFACLKETSPPVSRSLFSWKDFINQKSLWSIWKVVLCITYSENYLGNRENVSEPYIILIDKEHQIFFRNSICDHSVYLWFYRGSSFCISRIYIVVYYWTWVLIWKPVLHCPKLAVLPENLILPACLEWGLEVEELRCWPPFLES